MRRFSNWLIYQMISFGATDYVVSRVDPFWSFMLHQPCSSHESRVSYYKSVRFYWFLDYQASCYGEQMRYVELWSDQMDY